MRFVTYQSPSGPRVAGVAPGGYVDLQATDATLPTSLKQLLAQGASGLTKARAAIAAGQPIPPGTVRLLAPIHDPEKIICIGLNYADHAAETGAKIPSEPVVFNKFLTALRADGDDIVLPKASQEVDYEAELVAIIGKEGRNIPREQALAHVAGYAVGHDVSARDWQKGKPGGQWLLGKSFDSFAPLGPELVTADEVGDPGALAIELRLNGQTMQQSTTRQLIFAVDYLVAYLSQCVTLKPGDLIYTGTPPGVGMARKPPVWLKAGDKIEIEIEKIGILRNGVVAEG
ncbi:MAG TPA: fumarylacetoacetate hydrolase family protein [Pirellulaceae bacterium]|nr:fumarylacetoacetate hydrolase family protein [Pirellulaceae bacterium]